MPSHRHSIERASFPARNSANRGTPYRDWSSEAWLAPHLLWHDRGPTRHTATNSSRAGVAPPLRGRRESVHIPHPQMRGAVPTPSRCPTPSLPTAYPQTHAQGGSNSTHAGNRPHPRDDFSVRASMRRCSQMQGLGYISAPSYSARYPDSSRDRSPARGCSGWWCASSPYRMRPPYPMYCRHPSAHHPTPHHL